MFGSGAELAPSNPGGERPFGNEFKPKQYRPVESVDSAVIVIPQVEKLPAEMVFQAEEPLGKRTPSGDSL